MLVDLLVRDLVLIESASLAFGPGLNVITGETGAGKSLLVGALELLLGETPRGGAAAWVRPGAAEATVEARIALLDPRAVRRVRDVLERELPALAADLAPEDGGEAELVIGRSISAEGRTRAHVDHRPVTKKALRALAAELLEIHGQNDHQRLLDPREQRALLDAYGDLGAKAGAYREARDAWRALLARARRIDEERRARRDRLDLARFQLGELKDARLSEGEHAELEAERGLLRAAGELGGVLTGLAEELVEGDLALLDRLRRASRALERFTRDVPRLAAALEALRAAEVHVEDAAAEVASLAGSVEDDPRRLDAVEERLAELERLEEKHRTDAGGLIARREALRAEIARLEAEEEDAATLEQDLARLEAEVARRAAALTEGRRAVAPKLERELVAALAALGLGRARVQARVEPRAEPGAPAEERFGQSGADAVELVLAANPGLEPRPLRHVASGGEAARIMLALRSVLRASDPGRTLVFDEIDAGVGGRLGPEVGRHLRALAASAQVLCVTHLPAIAAHAHVHLRAAKEVRKDRTRTVVEALAGAERVREVAAMIAGGADAASARAEASRLLAEAGA